jgi:hypothetical protein
LVSVLWLIAVVTLPLTNLDFLYLLPCRWPG